MVKLRKLKESDAEFMFEWMQDKNIVSDLETNFIKMSLYDCSKFIINSEVNESNIHLAIANENDEYLGTVSLKNIDRKNKNAEYAIVLRSKAIGKGISKEATKLILDKAFNELELIKVYLCVFTDNIRAVRFYEKCNFYHEGKFRSHKVDALKRLHDLSWYSILKQEFDKKW